MRTTAIVMGYCLVVVSLTGCATMGGDGKPSWLADPNKREQIQTLIRQGKCAEAYAILGERPTNSQAISATLAAKGSVALDCENDKNKAIAYWQLSARYGYRFAHESLIKVGASIPYADLASSESAESSNPVMTGILQGIADGLNAPSSVPQTTFCDKTGRDTMTCRKF